MLTQLISPTHKTPYVLDDILGKGLDRSGLLGEIKIELRHTCFYGSKDFYVYADKVQCTDSNWCESVTFLIDGIIPIHATENGKLEYGFRCGCDTHHGGQFPSEADPDNSDWAEYQKTALGQISYYTVHYGAPTSDVHVCNIADIPSGDIAQEILLQIVETFVARLYFRSI